MKARVALLGLMFAWPIASANSGAIDCNSTYPQSQVAQTIADERFKKCDALGPAYSDYVVQQRELVRSLKPAYERELAVKEKKIDEKKAVELTKKKIKAFDEALERLAAASKLPKVDPAPQGSTTEQAKAAARKWLKAIKGDSQTLADRLSDVSSAFNPDERTKFCKEDYVVRISAELEKMLAVCFKE